MEIDSAEIQNLDIRNPDDPSAPVAVNANPDQEGGKSLAELLTIPEDNWRGPEPVEEVPQTSIEYPDYQPLAEPGLEPEGEIGPRVADLIGEEPTAQPEPLTFEDAVGLDEDTFREIVIANGNGIVDANELINNETFLQYLADGNTGPKAIRDFVRHAAYNVGRDQEIANLKSVAANWQSIQERPEIVAANEAREAKQMLGAFIQSQVEERQQQEFRDAHGAAFGGLVQELQSKGLRVPDGNTFFNRMVETGYIDLPPEQAVRATMDNILAHDPSYRGGREAGSYSKTFHYDRSGRVVSIESSPGAPERKPVAPGVVPSGGVTAGQRSRLDALLADNNE